MKMPEEWAAWIFHELVAKRLSGGQSERLIADSIRQAVAAEGERHRKAFHVALVQSRPFIEQQINEAVAAEREACAQVAAGWRDNHGIHCHCCLDIAAVIRNRAAEEVKPDAITES